MLECEIYGQVGRRWMLLEKMQVTGFGDPQLRKYDGMDVQLVIVFPTEVEEGTT